MKSIRIQGLVGVANRVRRELSGPLSPDRLVELRRDVAATLGVVDRVLQDNHGSARHLPTPSRRAYHFLSQLDLDQPPVDDPARSAPGCPPGCPPGYPTGYPTGHTPAAPSYRFPGLFRRVDVFLHALAEARPLQAGAMSEQIAHISKQVEQGIRKQRIEPEQLSGETRAARAWLAFFADEGNAADYLAAVHRGSASFTAALRGNRRFRAPPRLHFRPMKGIYRMRGLATGVLVSLPTAMITFDRLRFDALAQLAIRRRPQRQIIVDAMLDEPYQDMLAELESLGGVVEQAAGSHHDLAASFNRVNIAYFARQMPRPRLTWNAILTRRKFGHYDLVHDTVMLSRSLDQPAVPQYVIDFVMYHELLHKKHGSTWRNNRAMAHTSAFRREEQLFPRLKDAEAVLQNLARQR
ncbi:MAG: hypothetical protein WD042_12075 [Phycisphaeraceae bacterium]